MCEQTEVAKLKFRAGIKREELIDGIEEGGVAMYIDHVGDNANLFI